MQPSLLNCLVGRSFHTSSVNRHIIKLTRLRVVDNSEIGKAAMSEGKPPKCIHVYNSTGIGTIGDKILVAIKGEKKKAIIVGVRQKQKSFIPRFDTNNIVLIDDYGTPLGTRIHVPIPHMLRTILKEKNIAKGVDYTKLLALEKKPGWVKLRESGITAENLHPRLILRKKVQEETFAEKLKIKQKIDWREGGTQQENENIGKDKKKKKFKITS